MPDELVIIVLSPTEQILGYLDPEYVDNTEHREQFKLRGIDITHPMTDENDIDLSRYTNLLVPGNKIYINKTPDGDSCLYVIMGDITLNFLDKTVSVYAEEVATELGQNSIYRDSAFEWTVNESFIEDYFGNQFNPGILEGPGTTIVTKYSGAITPLGILRKIEELTGGEFQFRYELAENNIILRYIDYYNQIGVAHETSIELEVNATNITVKTTEADSRIGAGPIGEPADTDSTFHQIRKAFEDREFTTTEEIPLYITKDENGSPLNGPPAHPPYPKPAGQGFVVCNNEDELVSNYQRIENQAAKQPGSSPRICTFETSEDNIYNIYWECIKHIKQYLQPQISIKCDVIDIKKLQGLEGENYNIGDKVKVKLPHRAEKVEARILSTSKNPRKPESDTIEIGNYKINFMTDITGGYYNTTGNIEI